jgi:hypothetical protein
LELWVAIQRLLFTLIAIGSVVIVVGDAAVELWGRGDEIWAIVAVVLFPVTFLVWPWTHEAFGVPLWVFFLAGTVSYSIINAWDRSVGRAY